MRVNSWIFLWGVAIGLAGWPRASLAVDVLEAMAQRPAQAPAREPAVAPPAEGQAALPPLGAEELLLGPRRGLEPAPPEWALVPSAPAPAPPPASAGAVPHEDQVLHEEQLAPPHEEAPAFPEPASFSHGVFLTPQFLTRRHTDGGRGGVVLLPRPFDLRRFGEAGFIESRAAIQRRLADQPSVDLSEPDPPAVVDARLDLAELYLSELMVPEGLSLLVGLDLSAMRADQAVRWQALSLALNALRPAGDWRPGPDAPYGADYAGWPEQPLWQVVVDLRRGGSAPSEMLLRAASTRLLNYSDPVVIRLLPLLLEAAIDGEYWGLARRIATEFGRFDELRDSGAYAFLRGRVALDGGDRLAAFDYFARASEGADGFAQRARIALIDLGLSSGALPLEDARSLLRQARRLWRGDLLEAAVLQRLALIEYNLGDEVATLEVLGSIINGFAREPVAERAVRQSTVLLEQYYEGVKTSDVGLADLLLAHRRIAADYRFQKGFAKQAEFFADTFMDAGATGIAAREYGLIHDYLLVAQDLGMREVAQERLNALRMKQAGALAAGGQYEEAAVLLAADLPTEDAGLRDRWNLLRARVFAEIGQSAAVLGTKVAAPSEEYLRLMAEAQFASEDWEQAREAYARLWRVRRAELPFGDAINLLLAAYRSGDRGMALELARAFPDLTTIPQWSQIAAGLLGEAGRIDPLRAEAAQQRLDVAARTLENLKIIEQTSEP